MSASEAFRDEVQDLTCERPPRVMQVQTQRLRLRQWRNSDLEPYGRLLSDDNAMRYIHNGPIKDRDEWWRRIAYYIGHWALRGFGLYAVELKDTGQFIGRVGLYYPEGWPEIEVGWLIDPRHQGQGYATEAAKFCLFYAFEGMGLKSVISVIKPENKASIRVAEKLGGVVDREDVVRGFPCVIYRYAPERLLGL